ncbi:type II toxin-antitoxin system VapC family toxin [Pelomonas sp. KK5]|uniref:type II toxin-antitoxin system VapC family toxin n=1 Tax=Pelomonas sp. KK5 TaxID=1855730 RepID=UPI001301F686|nr:type II toxin-antitoxin system VapC family toxin [Pelomonas sp. KK5]
MIYLDSCLLIYAIERHPLFGEPTLAAMLAMPAGQLALSPLVKTECLVRPIRDADAGLRRQYERAFSGFRLLELSDAVCVQAAELRAHFGLKTPDALHLACALHHGCTALWTNDDRLARASHGLALNVLAR